MAQGATIRRISKELKRFGRIPDSYKISKMVGKTFEIKYRPGINSVTFIAMVKSLNSSPAKGSKSEGAYRVQITFNNVEYKENSSNVHTMPARVDRKLYWYKQPTLADNPVQIKSTDQDFRFRFEKELFDNKALIGGWRRYDAKKEDKKSGKSAKQIRSSKYFKVTHPSGGSYTRKTPKPNTVVDGITGLPFENPNGLMGFSYPVNTLLKYLVDKGFIGKK